MTEPRLEVGSAVEVHTAFNDSWTSGFEIAEVLAVGYYIRRINDRSLLPDPTGPSDVRAARAPNQWD